MLFLFAGVQERREQLSNCLSFAMKVIQIELCAVTIINKYSV